MLAEPFAVTDMYADGLDHVEKTASGNFRFVLYRDGTYGPEALDRAVVMALPDVLDAMCKTADAIGLRFAGTFTWDKPN